MLGLLNLRVVTGMSYLKNYANSADLFETTVKVTKEDKKQDKPKSKRKLQEEIDAIVEQFSNSIDTVKNNKKGVANAAKNLNLQHLLLSWLIALYFLMKKVKIEFLEAIRFNLNQEMADMIV